MKNTSLKKMLSTSKSLNKLRRSSSNKTFDDYSDESDLSNSSSILSSSSLDTMVYFEQTLDGNTCIGNNIEYNTKDLREMREIINKVNSIGKQRSNEYSSECDNETNIELIIDNNNNKKKISFRTLLIKFKNIF